MNIPFTELSDPPPQPALARRFIWRATWPMALVCGRRETYPVSEAYARQFRQM